VKLVSKYPFESLTFFVLLYYDGVLLFFESTSALNKISFFLISILIFLLVLVASFTFRKELNSFRKMFFSVFLTGLFQNSGIIIKTLLVLVLGLVPFLVCSSIEFLLTFLFTKAGGITIGFPLPIYSFTAQLFLWINLAINLLVYGLVVYFLGMVVSEDPKIKDF
jgi:hypothetical protein